MKPLPHNSTYQDVANATVNDHPAYRRMVEEARLWKLPHRFGSDLEHDRQALKGHSPERPFAWLLYERGTYFAFEPRFAAHVCETFQRTDDDRLYYWDGARLTRLPLGEVQHRLAEWIEEHGAVTWRKRVAS